MRFWNVCIPPAAGSLPKKWLLRQETYGFNEVVGKARTPLAIKFLSHFKSPITIVLLVAAVLSVILVYIPGNQGDISNAIIIFAIVLISVTLDFTQEYRAERAADELRKRVANTVTVYRGGSKEDISVNNLVPGDIIGLSVGDISSCRCACNERPGLLRGPDQP